METDIVYAIIVTYNRRELLIECLDGVLKQSFPVSGVVIVDNASQDSTFEHLKNNFDLLNQNIKYVNNFSNLGASKGFKVGMQLAYSNTDWFWLMDDDVEPEKNCLESQLAIKETSLCIHPSKTFKDGTYYSWDGKYDPWLTRQNWYYPERFNDENKTVFLNYGCFEGMLINKKIVEKIGLPDERFFIHSDDLIYGYLASKHTNVSYTRNALFLKKIKKENFVKRFGIRFILNSSFSEYYNIRNHFLIRKILIERGDASKVLSFLVVVLKFIKMLVMFLLIKGDWNGTRDIVKGFFHGVIGRFYK